jgi:hypothetical protein
MKSDRPRLLLLFYSPQLKARRKIITSQKKGLCLQREESTRPKSANVPRATDRGVGAMSIVESAAVLVSCKKHRLSYRWSVASTDRSSSAGSVGFLLHDNLQEKRTEKKTPKIEANPNKHMTTTHRRSRRDRTVKRVRSLIRPWRKSSSDLRCKWSCYWRSTEGPWTYLWLSPLLKLRLSFFSVSECWASSCFLFAVCCQIWNLYNLGIVHSEFYLGWLKS